MRTIAVLILLGVADEAALKKIETTLDTAKTLSLKVDVDVRVSRGGKEERMRMAGTMALKEGNKSRVAMKSTIKGESTDTLVVSDGKKMKEADGSVVDAPAQRNAVLKKSLSRYGVYLGSRMSAEVPLKDVRAGEDEGGRKTLHYMIALGPETLKVRVFYDGASGIVHRRVIEAKSERGEMKVEETYADLVLNGDVPDDQFRIPE